jgi:3',5'-nucleoside bisphosphate phosphatase
MKHRIDFHIHSCLSPCASLEMSPRRIVRRALAAGLDCIALADHNCAENLPAFHDACIEAGLPALYGMEVSTDENVHVLCLFDGLPDAMGFGRFVGEHLPPVPNDPERFGDQPVVTVEEEVVRFADVWLANATDISFFDLIPAALDAGALCIPSHIDREMCGALAHLGFLPDLPYDAVEALGSVSPAIASKWPVVRFSDAHHPDHIGRRFTVLETGGFTVPALRSSLQQIIA